MATVVLFPHVLGLTPGLRAIADRLRQAGHDVRTPDLFGGRTFDTLEAGIAFARSGEVDIDAQADALVEDLPPDLVYLGFSLGVMPAQRLAQTRTGARGAVLVDAAVPVEGEWAFGPWPAGVAVQIHGMTDDPIFAGEGDLEAAQGIVAAAADAELFLYPGDGHLFADASAPGYDADAAEIFMTRVIAFLDRVGAA